MTIDELRKLIKPLPQEMLLGLPEDESRVFSNYKIIPIELLVPADWNYKEEDKRLDGILSNNLKRNGQIENIHVRLLSTGYYEVINGNHRLNEMIGLGKKFVIAFDHGSISTAEAQRIALETNELKYKADSLKLSKLIKELSEIYDKTDLAETLPYSEQEINDYSSISDFDWNSFHASNEGSNEDEETFILELALDPELKEKWAKAKEIYGNKNIDCFVAILDKALSIEF
jgi:hypothetical protein